MIWTDNQRAEIIHLYTVEKKSARQLAELYQVKNNAIYGIIYRSGKASPRRLITEADRDGILRMHAEGMSKTEIGRVKGVHASTIKGWLRKWGVAPGKPGVKKESPKARVGIVPLDYGFPPHIKAQYDAHLRQVRMERHWS